MATQKPAKLSLSGNIPNNWRYFKQKFYDYYNNTSTDVDKIKSDQHKISALMSVIGDEGVELFNTFSWEIKSDRWKWAKVMEKYDNHCLWRRNVMVERYHFNTAVQSLEESIDEYVARLMKLARTCDFGELQNSFIRDRVIVGMKSEEAREQLLEEKHELSLEPLVNIVRSLVEINLEGVCAEASAIVDHHEVNVFLKKKLTFLQKDETKGEEVLTSGGKSIPTKKKPKARSGKRRFSCPDCGKKFVYQARLQIHLHSHKGQRSHVCPECGKGFFSAEGLERHTKKEHVGRATLVCKSCGQKFKKLTQLKKHSCGHNFTKKNNLLVRDKYPTRKPGVYDLKHEANPNNKTCHECISGFVNASDLNRHLLMHINTCSTSVKSDFFKVNQTNGERRLTKHSSAQKDLDEILDETNIAPDILSEDDNNVDYFDDSETEMDEPKQGTEKQGTEKQGTEKQGTEIQGKDFDTVKNRTEVNKLKHWKKKRFVCEICNKAFNRPGVLASHRMIHTGKKAWFCEWCGKSFSFQGSYGTHVRTHHPGEKPFCCAQCGAAFNKISLMKKHEAEHGGEKGKFENRAEPEQDLESRPPKRRHVCEICNKAFQHSSGLASHKVTHTGERPFTCKWCNKSFTFLTALKRHFQVLHPGKKSFQCSDCDASFSRQFHLTEHELKHQGKLICTTCGKEFNKLNVLRRHEKAHKKRQSKDFLCTTCGKILKSSRNLTDHMRTHSGISEFVCEECGKGFNRKRVLVNHLRKHSEFFCKDCGLSFRYRNTLKQHLELYHSSGKTVTKTAKVNHNLGMTLDKGPNLTLGNGPDLTLSSLWPGSHSEVQTAAKLHSQIETTSGGRPLKCKECGMGFLTDATLKKHMRRWHRETSQYQYPWQEPLSMTNN